MASSQSAALPVPAAGPVVPSGAVSADHPAVAQEMARVLREGGTAADAAIVGALVAGVVQPASSGLGGGGLALVYDASENTTIVIDFREAAPAGLKLRPYEPKSAKRPGYWVGVPGEVAGLDALHQTFGHTPWSELVGRAADVAERGFALAPSTRRALTWHRSWATPIEPYGTWLSMLDAGGTDDVKSPQLGATLRILARDGARSFYEGEIGKGIVRRVQAEGGSMTLGDLSKYRAVVREPLIQKWGDYEVRTSPPSSGGGLLIAQTLAMHTPEQIRGLGFQSGAYFHMLAETFRGAYADRIRYLGDPKFVKTSPADLLDASKLSKRRRRIRADQTLPPDAFTRGDKGTMQLLAADRAGDVVVFVSSVGDAFGAKLMTEQGVVLNEAIVDFMSQIEASRLGLGRSPNRARPGARPLTSMSPTLVFSKGAPVLALGGTGGTRIPTAITQVLLAHLLFERPLEEAIDLPRIHTPPSGGLLLDDGAPRALTEDLLGRGEVVRGGIPNLTGVYAIAWTADGLVPAWDARKGGASEVVAGP